MYNLPVNHMAFQPSLKNSVIYWCVQNGHSHPRIHVRAVNDLVWRNGNVRGLGKIEYLGKPLNSKLIKISYVKFFIPKC